MHQFANNAVNGRIEPAQIFGRTGLLRNAVQRRTQRLGALPLGDITIDRVQRCLPAAHAHQSPLNRYVYQRSIFPLSLGFQVHFLSRGQGLLHGVRLGAPIRRNDQRFDCLAQRLRCRITEHPRKFAVDMHHAIIRVQERDSLGCALDQLFQMRALDLRAMPPATQLEPFARCVWFRVGVG